MKIISTVSIKKIKFGKGKKNIIIVILMITLGIIITVFLEDYMIKEDKNGNNKNSQEIVNNSIYYKNT